MSATVDYRGGRDIAFGLLKAEWDAACQDLLPAGTPVAVLYQGVVQDEPGADVFWMRLSMQTVLEKKAKIGSPKRHTHYGVVFAQCFFPKSVAGAWELGLALGSRLKIRLAQPSSSATVWFRNPRQNELTPDDTHHRLNVVADCQYDELV